MKLLETPSALARRGIEWPKIVLVDKKDKPPIGMPYLRTDTVSDIIIFRLLLPTLEKKYSFFDWKEVFKEICGTRYTPITLEYNPPEIPNGNNVYGDPGEDCDITLEELACDMGSSVNMDILLELGLVPKFFGDIAEVIKTNVTNSYQWMDGYNKKLGICSGYLEAQPRKKSLVILDISGSIPNGLSAGMMTLIKTITDITNSDLIVTGSRSFFFSNEETRTMDIKRVRRKIGRSNERTMFYKILQDHNMDYDVVISFGDSDNPGEINLPYPIHTKYLYDYFIGKWDVYGKKYTEGTGYARWVSENCPSVNIVRNYKWAHLFQGYR